MRAVASGDPGAPDPGPDGPDPGLYGPDSEAWRLNREAMLLLGAGPRALLLQLAHPSVAAGVADHSDFRADPWRRLAGTLRSYLTVVYGSTGVARAEIRRLNALHRAITGPGYTARDPELSLWVHATLVDSTMAVADAWLEPMSMERRAAFYAETRPIGRAFGVPESLLPADIGAFDEYLTGCWHHPGRSGSRRRRASSRPWCSGRHSRRWPRGSGSSRSARTPGPCGRRSASCPSRCARTTACDGARANGSSRAGWSPAGGRGARSSPRRSARCRRRWPPTGGWRPAVRGSPGADPAHSPGQPARMTAATVVARRRPSTSS